MNATLAAGLVAVDIGNTRIKFGWFERDSLSGRLPVPARTLTLPVQNWNQRELEAWVGEARTVPWWIASVNRAATAEVSAWYKQHAPASTPANELSPLRILAHADLPITSDVAEPERVGLDRLAGAVAANALRDPRRAAIIVDVGTAMKLNVVSASGVFLGARILPGFAMAAQALHQFTDLLPLVKLDELHTEPAPLGRSTTEALRSGLYWGSVGALRQLVERLTANCGGRADVFLTGGDSPTVAAHLVPPAMHAANLVLSGIALAQPK